MFETYYRNCLYFTANRLSRIITKMAEEDFRKTGLSPTYAFLLMAVYEQEGITQKELSAILHLTPSTVTRFIEKLEAKRLVLSQADGRLSRIYSTEQGKALKPEIEKAWDDLHDRYSAILGREEGDELTLKLDDVSNELEKS